MSSKRKPQKKKSSPLPLFIILGVLVIAVVGGLMLVSRNRSEVNPGGQTNRQSEAELLANAQPGAQPPHTKGPENAPIQIEEFGDYECPACGRVFHFLKKIEAERGDRIHLVFRQNPLEMHR